MKTLLLIIALLAPAFAEGAIRYGALNGVGVACSDSNPCSIDTAKSQHQQGDAILLKDGYGYPQQTNPLVSGTAERPTTLACQNIDKCGLQSTGGANTILLNQARSHLRFAGLRLDRSQGTGSASCWRTASDPAFTGIIVEDVDCFAKGNIRGGFFIGVNTTKSVFRRVHTHDHGSHGFYIAGSFNTFEQIRVERIAQSSTGNTAYCAQIYVEGHSPQGNIFRDSLCDTGGGKLVAGSSGIYIGVGPNNQAYRNTVRNAVIAFNVRGANTKIWNNTIDGVSTAFNLQPLSNCEIKNNILLGKSTGSSSACTMASNLTAGKPEEFFVDAAKGDYRLKPTALVAIDNGAPIPGLPFKGARIDIGAWEFEAATKPPPDPIPDPKPDPVPVPKPRVGIDVTVPPEVDLDLKVNGVKR